MFALKQIQTFINKYIGMTKQHLRYFLSLSIDPQKVRSSITCSKRTYIELFHQPTLMHNFLYSLTICLLHYYKENCALKLVDEIVLYYDARSKKHQNTYIVLHFNLLEIFRFSLSNTNFSSSLPPSQWSLFRGPKKVCFHFCFLLT